MVRRREHHAQIGRIVRCEVDYLPRIEQLDILALRHIARPCIIEILSDLDAARRLGIPEIFGRLFVIGQRQQFVGHGFAHGLYQLGIGSRVHLRHSFHLAVTGIAVEEIHAIQIIQLQTGFHLRREVGDLAVGQVAESESRAISLQRKTDLAPLVLQRTDILVRMFQHIAYVRVKHQQGTLRIGLVTYLHDAQIDDIAVSPLPERIERRHGFGFLQYPNVGQQRLVFGRVQIEYIQVFRIQFVVAYINPTDFHAVIDCFVFVRESRIIR